MGTAPRVMQIPAGERSFGFSFPPLECKGVDMDKIITALIMAAVAIIGAFGSYIAAWLVKKKNDLAVKSLRDAIEDDGKSYYVFCPNCGQKILLRTAAIHIEEENKQ